MIKSLFFISLTAIEVDVKERRTALHPEPLVWTGRVWGYGGKQQPQQHEDRRPRTQGCCRREPAPPDERWCLRAPACPHRVSLITLPCEAPDEWRRQEEEEEEEDDRTVLFTASVPLPPYVCVGGRGG